jgi:NhaP-type Na+/H+ and K+/H+ antiporter
MSKFYKYFLIILGASALFDFFSILFSYQEVENFTIITFKVTKTAYLIYRFSLGVILIIAGIKTKVK